MSKEHAPEPPRDRLSQDVTTHNNALDLEKGVFSPASPPRIASSLECPAENSRRRKASAFQPAMSMPNFYINRAGKNPSADRRHRLDDARAELRRLYGK
jgi:hypothetical protein